MKRLKLRLHHLMCCYTFDGVGYNDAFTQNMAQAAALLYGKEPLEVELTDGCDDLCAACPHNLGGRCDTEESVHARDIEVGTCFGFQAGEVLVNHELLARLLPKQSGLREIGTVCRKCPFTELCNRVLQKKNYRTPPSGS